MKLGKIPFIDIYLRFTQYNTPIIMAKSVGDTYIIDTDEAGAIKGNKLEFLKINGDMPIPEAKYSKIMIDRFGRKRVGYSVLMTGDKDFKPIKWNTLQRMVEPVDEDTRVWHLNESKKKVDKYRHPGTLDKIMGTWGPAIFFLIMVIGFIAYVNMGWIPAADMQVKALQEIQRVGINVDVHYPPGPAPP